MNFGKACLTVFLMLSLLTTGVFRNADYIDETAEHILSVLDNLPDDTDLAEGSVIILMDYWEERTDILRFTLSDASIEKVSLLFDELLISIRNGDIDEYQKTTAHLRRAVESINELEKITLKNIF